MLKISKKEVPSLVVLFVLIISSLVQVTCIPVPHKRFNRQVADTRAAQYMAYLGLDGFQQRHRGCKEFACGVVDVYSAGRRKRDHEEKELMDYLRTWSQLPSNK